MDPLSRKLFQTSSARERLSQMGGIMASSPELASTVARFQVGGLVGEPEYVVIIPGVTDRRGMRVRASTLEMIGQANPELLQRSQVMDSATAQSMGIDVPSVRPGDAILSRQLGPQPATAPTPAPAPLGPDAMDLFSENFGVDDMPPPGPVPAPPPTPAEAIGLDPGPVPRLAADDMARIEGAQGFFPSIDMPFDEDRAARELGEAIRDRRRDDVLRRRLLGDADTAEAAGRPDVAAELRAAAEQMPSEELLAGEQMSLADEMTSGDPLAADNIEDILPPAREQRTPPPAADEQPTPPPAEDPLQELGTQLDRDLRTFFGIEQPSRAPGSRRERVEQELELIREVFGDRTRDQARDRAMNLAMIGLAIAAGQSPNMLTNIAQGALAGTQAMQRAQAAAQEREDEQRMLAYRNVLEEDQEARRLGQAMGMERFRASLQGSGVESPFNTTGTASPLSGFRARERSLEDRIVAADSDPIRLGWNPDRPLEEQTAEAMSRALDAEYALWLNLPETAVRERQELFQLVQMGIRQHPNSVPAIVARTIESLRAENRSEQEIARLLRADGHDPRLFGVTP